MPATFDAGKRVVATLTSAGLRATQDSRNVTPPVALLDRPSLLPLGNNCVNVQAEWVLHLIEKGPDNAATWERLDRMVDAVFAVYGPTITSCTPDTYPINETTDVASYRVTFQEII